MSAGLRTKRVVLVFPRVMPPGPSARQWDLLPLSVLSLASPLLEAGYEVTLIDQRVDDGWRGALESVLNAGDVACVGVSAMTGYPIAGALDASRLAKEASPATPVVWGGVHPSLLAEQTLASPLVDLVVRGEGEASFLALVRALEAGGARALDRVPGLSRVEGARVVHVPPAEPLGLDALPAPAYGLVDVGRYLNAPFAASGSRPLAFATSRGCPFRCRYCYNLAFNRGRWRGMSADRVQREAARLVAEHGVDGLFLLDDNFFANPRRVREICDLLVREGPAVRFLNANCRVDSIDSFSAEDLARLREAGFDELFVGVESGSDRVLAHVGKGTAVEQTLRANRKLEAAGIVPVYSFMVGMPGETREDMEATLALMVRLRDDHPAAVVNALNIYSPFPGTPLYDEAVSLGMPEPATLRDWAEVDYVRVNYAAGFSAGDLAFMRKASLLSAVVDDKLGAAAGRDGFARRAYCASVRWRVRHRLHAFTPELGWLERRRESAVAGASPRT